jgi:acetate kinase
MKILVVNAGSSSLKFQLIDSNKKFKALYKGIVDGIGRKSCFVDANAKSKKIFYKKLIKNHEQAVKEALKIIGDEKIDAIGHRVVHGGEKYHDATRITPQVKKTIKNLIELAPLHNPPNLEGINACEKLLKGVPNIAIFDTAFHQTIPEKAFHYALPEKFYKKYKVRKYGFHGTSHKYVSNETYKLLRSLNKKIITCHLGNGSSLSAVKNGKCIETSMGFTPLEGVPMGTRSGSIDPAIVFYLMEKEKINTDKIDHILNNESGILGVSGISSDIRDIRIKAKKKNKKALFTLDLLAYKIALHIGAYAAALDGVSAITFTAGIGQNAWYLRRDICKYLKYLGVKLDPKKNRKNEKIISEKSSKVKIFVIKTNEGLQIAREVSKIIS